MKNKARFLVILVILVLVISSCAAGPNPYKNVADQEGEVAGFLLGVWHGAISIVTFVISLFSDKVNVYETHNNGGWYNFGFICGILIAYGGGSRGTCRNRD